MKKIYVLIILILYPLHELHKLSEDQHIHEGVINSIGKEMEMNLVDEYFTIAYKIEVMSYRGRSKQGKIWSKPENPVFQTEIFTGKFTFDSNFSVQNEK